MMNPDNAGEKALVCRYKYFFFVYSLEEWHHFGTETRVFSRLQRWLQSLQTEQPDAVAWIAIMVFNRCVLNCSQGFQRSFEFPWRFVFWNFEGSWTSGGILCFHLWERTDAFSAFYHVFDEQFSFSSGDAMWYSSYLRCVHNFLGRLLVWCIRALVRGAAWGPPKSKEKGGKN